MVIKAGEKVHILTRRLFPEDLRRHFAGEIKAVDGSLARVEGYVFVSTVLATIGSGERRNASESWAWPKAVTSSK